MRTAIGVTAGLPDWEIARTSPWAGSTQTAIIATTIRCPAGAPYMVRRVQVGGLIGVRLNNTERMVTSRGRPAVLVVVAAHGTTMRHAGTGLAGVMMKATDVRIMQTMHGAIAPAASALDGTPRGEHSRLCLVIQQLSMRAVHVEGVPMRA